MVKKRICDAWNCEKDAYYSDGKEDFCEEHAEEDFWQKRDLSEFYEEIEND